MHPQPLLGMRERAPGSTPVGLSLVVRLATDSACERARHAGPAPPARPASSVGGRGDDGRTA